MAGETTQLGPFAVGERVGEGGMGMVYRGEHRPTGVPVAVKISSEATDRSARRRFHEEVQAHAGLLHPGIVYLFEFGELQPSTARQRVDPFRSGSPYVVMELADRGTVRDAMPISDWPTVCRLLVQILDALAYSHARGVIHRDLKPENFLIFADETGSEWRVKLADFGIAHAFQREREATLEELGSVAGTPQYMAPEQLRGRWREYGPWTDLYALGCITWELVCGRAPFQGDDLWSIAVAHETDERPPLDPQFEVPDELESWIRRALAVDPKRRFRCAADAAWALPRAALAQSTSSSDESTQTTGAGEELAETIGETAVGETAPDTAVASVTSTLHLEPDLAKAETATAPDHELSAPPPEATEEPPDNLWIAHHPPVPHRWRPEQVEPRPAPLVGAGLGLFGLRDPPFVDRQTEGDGIWEQLHAVVESGDSRLVLLAGEAGTGKSRLAEWMATRAHELGAARIVRVVHTRSGGPSEGLRGALERTFRTLKMQRSEVYDYLVDKLGRLAGEVDEDVIERDARAMTEYLRPTDDEIDEIDGPKYRFSSAGQKYELLVRVLARLAERRRVLLWLDDLHWGSEAIGLLEHLFEMRGDRPELLVLATVRSDLVADDERRRNRLDNLASRRSVTRISIDPLSRADQRELLDGLLPLEERLAERLAERTEGHPLFAMQLIAHWIDEEVIEVGESGFRVHSGHEPPLPDDIHEVWIRRLRRLIDDLESEAREIWSAVERAAALGREVDGDEWRTLCEAFATVEPDAVQNALVARGLAERTAEGWAFAHGMLVESLERRAREHGDWRDHHRRCGRLLERLYPNRRSETAARRADHWVAAGELDDAVDALWEEAERLHYLGHRHRELEILERRSELLARLGADEDDRRRLQNEKQLAVVGWHEYGGPDETIDVLQRLHDRARPLEDDELVAKILTVSGWYERRRGDAEAARDAAKRAVQHARQGDNPTTLADALLAWGWTAYFAGDLQAAERRFSEARQIADSAGDRPREIEYRRALATVSSAKGNTKEAESRLETLLEESRRAGLRASELTCSNELAELARFDGDAERARRLYRRHARLARELDRPGELALSQLNQGLVELMEENLDSAGKLIDEAVEQYEASSLKQEQIHFIRLAKLTHAAGCQEWAHFDELFSHYDDGWPEDAPLIQDHPWLLKLAGKFAADAGETTRARGSLRLARRLWQKLDDDDAARTADEQLAALDG